MKKAIALLIITAVLILVTIVQALYIQELHEEIQIALDSAQEAESSAYQDCQHFMQIEARIQRVNGCYATIEELCGRTDRPIMCMEKMIDTCTRIK